MTPEEQIKTDIDTLAATVNNRPNPYTGTKGWLLRSDVDAALIIYNDNSKKTQNVADFVNHLTFLSDTDKVKTVNDAQSYIDV